MQFIGRVVVIMSALLCGGCSYWNKSMRPIPLAEYPATDVYGVNVDTGQVGRMTSAFSSTEVPILSEKILEYALTSSAHRDWVQDALLQRSDALCGQYIDYLYAQVTARKFGLSEITTIANAVGTLSTTQGVTKAMTFIATISNSTSANFDSEVLQSQLITLVITQMKRNREQILGLIMSKREQSTVTSYPVSLAIRDADRYHQQCSFLAGMSGLTEAAQKPSPSSQPQSNTPDANKANAEAATAQAGAAAPGAQQQKPVGKGR
ncbi:hypothetical protein [Xanthobacter versatilis]|uniref:hypothetical protein n=1 Tax=Xanthobacter autotrophicus (strain ATCC BAA-1158 / Py2) TaxID=78245 RepID=UPI003728DB7C